MKTQAFNLEDIDKGELHALCDRLLADDQDAVEKCVVFIEAETLGFWHGRARAMMARRLKHCRLSQLQRQRVVHAILNRLIYGCFSEQFKDQLRLVLHLAPQSAFAVAHSCHNAATEYVRRYATWVLSHETGDTDNGREGALRHFLDVSKPPGNDIIKRIKTDPFSDENQKQNEP